MDESHADQMPLVMSGEPLICYLSHQEKQFFYQCRQHIHALNTQPRRGLRATIKGSSGRQQSQMWRDSYERSS